MKQPGIHIYDFRGICLVAGQEDAAVYHLVQKSQLIIAVQFKIVLVRHILDEAAAVAFVELKALYFKVLAAFRAEIVKHLASAVHGCFIVGGKTPCIGVRIMAQEAFAVEDVSGTAFQAGAGFIYIYIRKIAGLSVLCLNLYDGKGEGDAVIYELCVLQFVLQG